MKSMFTCLLVPVLAVLAAQVVASENPCLNGGDRTPCDCPPPPAHGSTIVPLRAIYIHDVPVYRVGAGDLKGGCIPCGASASTENEAKGLPSLELTRYLRSRSGDGQGSLGYGHFLNIDIHVRLDWAVAPSLITPNVHDVQARLYRPDGENLKTLFSDPAVAGGSLDGHLTDKVGGYREMRLLDADGLVTADGPQVRFVEIEHQDGQVWRFEVIDVGYGATARAGRLVSITDRRGIPTLRLTYQVAAGDDVGTDVAKRWMVAAALGADGSTATFTYESALRYGRHGLKSIVLPNGSVVNFTYASYSLTKIQLPDGAIATFVRTVDASAGEVATAIVDPAAEPGHQRKTVVWTDYQRKLADGTVIPQVSGHFRRLTNAAGEVVAQEWVDRQLPGVLYFWHRMSGLSRMETSSAGAVAFGVSYASHYTLGDEPSLATFDRGLTTKADTRREFNVGLTDALGRSTGGDRDGAGRWTRRVNVDGVESRTAYDTFGNPTEVTDRLGRVTVHGFDAKGNRLSKQDPTGAVWSYAYDDRGLLSTATDPTGVVTTYGYDLAGHLAAVTRPGDTVQSAWVTRRFTYDAAGRLVRTEDEAGRAVVMAYDGQNHLVRRTYADGSVETWSYQDGLVAIEADRNGVETRYTYDAAGRAIATVRAANRPEAETETCGYLPGGLTKVSCDRAGVRTQTAYDDQGRVTGEGKVVSQGKTLWTITDYDVLGRSWKTTDPYGFSTFRVFDANDRVISTVREVELGAIAPLLAPAEALSPPKSLPNSPLTNPKAEVVDNGMRYQVWSLPGDSQASVTLNNIDMLGGGSRWVLAVAQGNGPSAPYVGVSVSSGGLQWIGRNQAGRAMAGLRPLVPWATLPAFVADSGTRQAYAPPKTHMSGDNYNNYTFLKFVVQGNSLISEFSHERLEWVKKGVNWEPAPVWVPQPTISVQAALRKLENFVHAKVPLNINMNIQGSVAHAVVTTADGATVVDLGSVTLPLGPDLQLFVTARQVERTDWVTTPAIAQAVSYQVEQSSLAVTSTGTPSPTSVTMQRQAILAGLSRIAGANPSYTIDETRYDAEGQVIAKVDAVGAETQFSYDLAGRQTEVRAQLNADLWAVTSTRYDAAGRVIERVDPTGLVTRWNMTRRGLVAQQVVAPGTPEEATTIWTYSPTGKMLTMTDALQRTTVNTWGVCCDRLVAVTDPLGFVTQLAYDRVGNHTVSTDPNGVTITKTFDGLNRLVAVTNGAGEVSRTLYAPGVASGLVEGLDPTLGRTTVSVDALGARTTQVQDGSGRLVYQSSPLGQVQRAQFDAMEAGFVLETQVDATGATARRARDGSGFIRREVDAAGSISTASRDAVGRTLSRRNATGVGSDQVYDLGGRPVTTTETTGASTTRTYDALGRVLAVQDALGGTEATTQCCSRSPCDT